MRKERHEGMGKEWMSWRERWRGKSEGGIWVGCFVGSQWGGMLVLLICGRTEYVLFR